MNTFQQGPPTGCTCHRVPRALLHSFRISSPALLQGLEAAARCERDQDSAGGEHEAAQARNRTPVHRSRRGSPALGASSPRYPQRVRSQARASTAAQVEHPTPRNNSFRHPPRSRAAGRPKARATAAPGPAPGSRPGGRGGPGRWREAAMAGGRGGLRGCLLISSFLSNTGVTSGYTVIDPLSLQLCNLFF